MRVTTRCGGLLPTSPGWPHARTRSIRRSQWCSTPETLRLRRRSIMRFAQGKTEHVGTPRTTVGLRCLILRVRLWAAMRLVTGDAACLLSCASKRMTPRMAFRTAMHMSRSSEMCRYSRRTHRVERWERSRFRNAADTRLPSNGLTPVVRGVYPCRPTRIRSHCSKRMVRGFATPYGTGLPAPYDKRLCMPIANNDATPFCAHSAECLAMRL